MKARTICFANSAIAVEWDGELPARLVDFLFGGIPDTQQLQPHVTFSLSNGESKNDLRLSASLPNESYKGSYGEMALHLMERASYHLADRSSGGALFHAACLSLRGKALLLAGTTGAGKSSLALWLASQGFSCLTDEITFVPSGSLGCHGFSRPVHLKPPADALFPGLLENTSPRSLSIGAAGWLVPASAPGGEPPEQPPPLHRIVFPRYSPGAPFQFERLSKANTAVTLAGMLVNARNLTDHGFPQLVALARTVPSYQMTYGSFEPISQILGTFLS